MKTNLLKKVRVLFNSHYVPTHVNRHNQREWVRAIRQLGDRMVEVKQGERA